jgi:hypothetical protein
MRKFYEDFYTRKKYKNFWNTDWKYNKTVEYWVEHLNLSTHKPQLKRALTKFQLDGQINQTQLEELSKMIDSPDRENFTVVLSIMSYLRPHAFGERKPRSGKKRILTTT